MIYRHDALGRYKCPRCLGPFCSLECQKAHKEVHSVADLNRKWNSAWQGRVCDAGRREAKLHCMGVLCTSLSPYWFDNRSSRVGQSPKETCPWAETKNLAGCCLVYDVLNPQNPFCVVQVLCRWRQSNLLHPLGTCIIVPWLWNWKRDLLWGQNLGVAGKLFRFAILCNEKHVGRVCMTEMVGCN